MATYYAAPSAGGSGNVGNPFSIGNFWAVAVPGDTLILTGTNPLGDGFYAGTSNNMIQPSAGKAGTAGSPITIMAENDGGVLIDGQYARNPISTNPGNDYFIMQGFDCAHGFHTNGVISIHSNNNILRRIVGYDAQDDWNAMVYQAWGSSNSDTTSGYNNLFEDCAGFGMGRKIFQSFNSNGNTFRRCWARWEGSRNNGPKRSIQTNYHSYNTIIENCITRWDGRGIPTTPYLLQNSGANYDPGAGSCPPMSTKIAGSSPSGFVCQFPGYVIDGGGGVIAEETYTAGTDPSPNCGDKIRGSLICVTTADIYQSSADSIASSQHGGFCPQTFMGYDVDGLFVYIQNGVVDKNAGITPIAGTLFPLSWPGGLNSTMKNSTLLAQGNNVVGSQWVLTNVLQSHNDLGALGSGSLYEGASGATSGAALKYQWVNDVLTTNPLWPWPMSARIQAATQRASTDGHNHAVEDVDGYIQSIFGAFPSYGGVWFTG